MYKNLKEILWTKNDYISYSLYTYIGDASFLRREMLLVILYIYICIYTYIPNIIQILSKAFQYLCFYIYICMNIYVLIRIFSYIGDASFFETINALNNSSMVSGMYMYICIYIYIYLYIYIYMNCKSIYSHIHMCIV
jgi:hypothetical protein